MNSSLSVSAPGKIILHGEHSVVYGKKAIACSIDSRVKINADVVPESLNSLIVNMPAVNLYNFAIDCSDLKAEVASCKDYEDIMCVIDKKCSILLLKDRVSDFTQVAISCILYAYCRTICGNKVDNPRISICVQSEIPIGAGLGSSAAFNTSIACTFLLLSQNILPPEKSGEFTCITNKEKLNAINLLAFQMERIVHKTPSGIDNAIATFGGAVIFQNGVIKHVEKMPILELLVVNSKVPRSTKTLVFKVQQYLSHYPSVVSPILDSMDAIVSAVELILEKLYDNAANSAEIFSEWTTLIETNQGLLEALGVGHKSLNNICAISRKFKCPAKLTGAGGGGCAIIFLDSLKDDQESISQLKKELVFEGYECFKACIGGDGVLVKAF